MWFRIKRSHHNSRAEELALKSEKILLELIVSSGVDSTESIKYERCSCVLVRKYIVIVTRAGHVTSVTQHRVCHVTRASVGSALWETGDMRQLARTGH